jgi:hypothetical protein
LREAESSVSPLRQSVPVIKKETLDLTFKAFGRKFLRSAEEKSLFFKIYGVIIGKGNEV